MSLQAIQAAGCGMGLVDVGQSLNFNLSLLEPERWILINGGAVYSKEDTRLPLNITPQESSTLRSDV